MDFIDKMEYVYGASDIVVSRAGAMAVNEISLLKKIDFSTATSAAANHQYYNARYFSDNNAAILIEEKALANNILKK